MPFDKELFIREAVRKSIHMGGFILPLAYYFFLSRELMLLILGLSVLVAGALEMIRLSGNPIFPSILLRKHEKKGLVGGYFFALLSSFLAILLFDKTIAVVAILFLNFGDAITGLAGAVLSMYRGQRNAYTRTYANAREQNIFSVLLADLTYALQNHKSPFLMGVMLLVCGLIGLLFYPSLSLPAIAAGAAGAMLADAFPWRVHGIAVDDNLMIPLLSGALMTLASMAH